MNKKGNGSKTVFSSTEGGVITRIQIHHNPRTDHIMFGAAQFQKSFRNGAPKQTRNVLLFSAYTWQSVFWVRYSLM